MLAFLRCLSNDLDSQTTFISPPEGLGSRLASAGPFFSDAVYFRLAASIRRGFPVIIWPAPRPPRGRVDGAGGSSGALEASDGLGVSRRLEAGSQLLRLALVAGISIANTRP